MKNELNNLLLYAYGDNSNVCIALDIKRNVLVQPAYMVRATMYAHAEDWIIMYDSNANI